MNISPDKLENFTVLFEEFINSYPNTSKGIKHIKSYSQQREAGRRNYQAILEAKEAGEDITDRVLLQLLPYKNTKKNREQGAWIHTSYLTPSILEKIKYNSSYEIAEAFVQSINNVLKNNNELSKLCQILSQSPLTRNWQANFIASILNAIKPDSFILINEKSISVINYFADTNYSYELIDYPAINKVGWQLIKDLSSIMERFDLPALRQDDLFDMFCHWLIIEKEYNFKFGLIEGDLVTNYSRKELEIEEENTMLKVHPDSYFNNETFVLLRNTTIWVLKNKQLYSQFEREVENPFVKICSEIIGQLSQYTNCKLFTTKAEFTNDSYTLICNIKLIREKLLTNSQVEILFCLDINSFDFEISIKEPNESNIISSKIRENMNLLINKYDYLLFAKNRKLECEFYNSELKGFKKVDNILLFWKLFKMPRGYSGFKIKLGLTQGEILETSATELINIIVQTFCYLYPIIIMAISENPEKEIEEHLKIWNPKYKLKKYVDATYIEESQLRTWIKSITRKKQAIFYGSPGTGKTFIAENIAQYLIGGGDGFYELIQFHPAYSYEDFIQGIRPQTKDNGQLLYNLVPGRFWEFCRQAAECQDKCVLIIDEINRANLAEVFGELMYLLEYREQEICLAGSQEKFKIPDNVYIIGTMNTADRSIALVDFALRRRFAFIKIAPNYDIITKFHQQHPKLEVTGLIAVLKEINNLIEDENYYLGVSFFLTETLTKDLENIWQMEIEPYLEEYFCDRLDEIKQYQWEKIRNKILP